MVLVSGASRGIGHEIMTALTYARARESLSLLARSPEALTFVKDAIAKEIPQAQVELFKTDVTDPFEVQVKAAIEGTIDTSGKVNIVVANAGKVERWDKLVAIRSIPNINAHYSYHNLHRLPILSL